MYEKSFEIRNFLVFLYWEKAKQAPSWAARAAGEG